MRLVQWYRSRPQWLWSTLGAVAFAAVSLVPALSPYGLTLGELSTRSSDALHIALILLQTLPLAARKVAPGWVLAVVGAAFFADQALGYPPSPAGLGMLVALYSAGVHLERHRRLTAALCALVYVVLAVVLTALGSRERPWEFATFAVVLGAAWGAGSVVRLRGAAAAARERSAAKEAAQDERDRLARELHDVVSHHVTNIVVQADSAAIALPADDALLREQFASIAAGGRRALADLRELLEVLGPGGAAAPREIGDLRELAAEARLAGQPVDLREVGQPLGTDELRLAVYRTVQEGLTNAVKHATGAGTNVRVDWDPAQVRVNVTTERADAAVPGRTPAGSGRGLAGLTERVRALGGSLSAQSDDEGRFVLEATIPAPAGGVQ